MTCQVQNALHVELDSFPQMEKTNVPNVDQVNLKHLKVMMVVVVDTVTTKFHFFLYTPSNTFTHKKFHKN